jgi:uncharacterized protein YdhG (YjbR/CyaY superfamily)
MGTRRAVPRTVNEYIAGFPADVQRKLRKIRKTINEAAPGSGERISYGMPTFTLKGDFLGLAAWAEHISLYPAPTGSKTFNKKLSRYRAAKSTVRFPLSEPIPYDLVAQIVKLRVKDNL